MQRTWYVAKAKEASSQKVELTEENTDSNILF